LKKIFAASAVLVIIFIILYLTGVLDFKNTINKSLIEGNKLYSEEKYSEALASYQKGLSKDPGHAKLSYNAAQASYVLQNYEEADEYYAKAAQKIDTYLNWGNSYFKAVESSEDINQKLQFYIKALETYKQGILKYPENVELKFNYEFTEEKIKELQDSMNQNQPQNENNDNQEDKQDNGQNSQSGEENEEEQQNGQSGDSEQNEQDRQENNNQNNNEDEEQQNQETEQSSGQDDTSSEESGGNQQEEQEPSGLSETDDSKVGEADDRIEQVLKMLEKQEEQALKNNRHIEDYGREDEYDW